MAKEKFVFLIEVNYKSGKSQRFWVKQFSVDENECKWTTIEGAKRPILFGYDMEVIESIYQLENIDEEVFRDHYDFRDLRTSFEKERGL